MLCGEPEKGKKDIFLIPVYVTICVWGETAFLTMLLARRFETICHWSEPLAGKHWGIPGCDMNADVAE